MDSTADEEIWSSSEDQVDSFLNFKVELERQGLIMGPMVLRVTRIFREEPDMLGSRGMSLHMVKQQRKRRIMKIPGRELCKQSLGM